MGKKMNKMQMGNNKVSDTYLMKLWTNLVCSNLYATLVTRMVADSIIQKNELFSSYLESIGQFFLANDIKNEWKKATFLILIGSQAYSLHLVLPTHPKEKSSWMPLFNRVMNQNCW